MSRDASYKIPDWLLDDWEKKYKEMKERHSIHKGRLKRNKNRAKRKGK